MADEDKKAVQRFSKNNIVTNLYIRFITRPLGEITPYLRFAVIPSMWIWSMYFVDPPCSVWELINPFTK